MLIKDFKRLHNLTDQQFQRAARQAEQENLTVRQDRQVLDGVAILSRVKRKTVLDDGLDNGTSVLNCEVLEADPVYAIQTLTPSVAIAPMALDAETMFNLERLDASRDQVIANMDVLAQNNKVRMMNRAAMFKADLDQENLLLLQIAQKSKQDLNVALGKL